MQSSTCCYSQIVETLRGDWICCRCGCKASVELSVRIDWDKRALVVRFGDPITNWNFEFAISLRDGDLRPLGYYRQLWDRDQQTKFDDQSWAKLQRLVVNAILDWRQGVTASRDLREPF